MSFSLRSGKVRETGNSQGGIALVYCRSRKKYKNNLDLFCHLQSPVKSIVSTVLKIAAVSG